MIRTGDDSVLIDGAGGIAVVTLNRPERHNALGRDMLEGLLAGLERLAGDDAVRVVILTGTGSSFCPGADVATLAEPGADDRDATGEGAPSFHTRVGNTRRWMRIAELLREMPKVTIAAVNGSCAGAGLSWALACDLRVAARSAVLRTAFVGVGASGDFGASWTLPRVVGWGKARELLFLNEKLSADEALRIGLVGRVVDDDSLQAEVRALAEQLAATPVAGLLGMKQNLLDSESVSLAESLNLESHRLSASLGTEESRAAARAFLDRRP